VPDLKVPHAVTRRPIDDDELLTLGEAADRLRVTSRTAYRLAADGRLPVRVPGLRATRVRAVDRPP
jgi:excisionase family DNA binding protein